MSNKYKLDKLHTFTKILVADNVFYVKRSMSKILSEAGYFVLTAASGDEAIGKYRKYSPDLVITGRKLTDMRGYDLIKSIREEQYRHKIKIMFISRADEEDEINTLLLDITDSIISTPIEKDDLISAVKELLLLKDNF